MRFESRGLCRCPDCTRWNRAYECRSKAPSVTIIPVPTYPTGGPSRLTFAPSNINDLEGKKSNTLPLLTGAVCRVCETPIPQARRGKPKQFCSAACKQWACAGPLSAIRVFSLIVIGRPCCGVTLGLLLSVDTPY